MVQFGIEPGASSLPVSGPAAERQYVIRRLLVAEINSSHRTTRAFCVGQAKAGTASLCGLLGGSYRAAHEPEREQTLEMILRMSRGEVDANSFDIYLQKRDQRLNLDFDIAWANQFIIRHLLTVFPDATFIILLRDPYTWMQSMVGHLISRQISLDVRNFLNWWFKPEQFPHTRHDRVLEPHGVYSIAAYLNAWNQHVRICTQVIPPERSLILRTHELEHAHQRIADFLEIPPESLDTKNGHVNRSTWAGRLDSLVEAAYLSETINSICNDSMARHFPEISSIEDAYTLWDHPDAGHEGPTA